MNLNQLFNDYDSADARKRLSTIRELTALNIVEAVPLLLRALQDSAFEVRVHAAIALGNLGDVRAVGALLLMVHDTRLNRDLLPNIWQGLAYTQDPRATEALVDLIEITFETPLRYDLVRFLGLTQDPRILDMLLDWLDDYDAMMAAAAAQALAHYGDTRALPRLRRYVQDPDERVRDAVLAAIKTLETQ